MKNPEIIFNSARATLVSAMANVKPKIPLAVEKDKIKMQQVADAMVDWNLSGKAKEFNVNFQTKEGVLLSPEEQELVGWCREYMDQQKVTVDTAIADVFFYLSHYPTALAEYAIRAPDTNKAVMFSEAASYTDINPGFKNLKMARVFQGVTGHAFIDAVRYLEKRW